MCVHVAHMLYLLELYNVALCVIFSKVHLDITLNVFLIEATLAY